jgi:hypothetical protein
LAWAVVARLRDGRRRPPSLEGGDPLDAFIPAPDVDEADSTRVRAPAPVALEAAKELDIQRSPLVWLIFNLRTLPTRLRGASVRWGVAPARRGDPGERLGRSRGRPGPVHRRRGHPALEGGGRRYWAAMSPGIRLIRYEMLRLVRREAER